MLKTLSHIIVAMAIWFCLSIFDVGVAWRVGAIVVGAFAVHWLWERFVFNPYLYLGAMPVANDDPIMQKACAKAVETLPVFLETIFPEHREDSMVKHRFKTSSGTIENLWADLLEVNGDRLQVYIRTPPLSHDQPLDRNQQIDRADVIDWQVEYQDGTLRGGYTTRALFTIFEREQGYLHPKLRLQLDRFRDVDEMTKA